MRKVKEVLRLGLELGLGQRQIARSCGVGLGTVHDYLERAATAGIGWPLPQGLSEEELERKLFGNQPVLGRFQSSCQRLVLAPTPCRRRKAGCAVTEGEGSGFCEGL